MGKPAFLETQVVQADTLAVLNFRFELQKARPTAHRMSSSAALVQGDTHDETHLGTMVSKSPVSLIPISQDERLNEKYNEMKDIPMLERGSTADVWRQDNKSNAV